MSPPSTQTLSGVFTQKPSQSPQLQQPQQQQQIVFVSSGLGGAGAIRFMNSSVSSTATTTSQNVIDGQAVIKGFGGTRSPNPQVRVVEIQMLV